MVSSISILFASLATLSYVSAAPVIAPFDGDYWSIQEVGTKVVREGSDDVAKRLDGDKIYKITPDGLNVEYDGMARRLDSDQIGDIVEPLLPAVVNIARRDAPDEKERTILKRSSVYSGSATYTEEGTEACGKIYKDSDLVVGVSAQFFDSFPGYKGGNPNKNPLCGKKIIATYKGKSVIATVADRNIGAAEFKLNFSPSAFSELANTDLGSIDDVTWSVIYSGIRSESGFTVDYDNGMVYVWPSNPTPLAECNVSDRCATKSDVEEGDTSCENLPRAIFQEGTSPEDRTWLEYWVDTFRNWDA